MQEVLREEFVEFLTEMGKVHRVEKPKKLSSGSNLSLILPKFRSFNPKTETWSPWSINIFSCKVCRVLLAERLEGL